MPKIQFLDPKESRKASSLKLKPIPVNQYNKTVKDELKNFSKDELVRIYHDMVVIREFETMLNLIQTTGEYNGVAYNHSAPAHLRSGQEAAAVRMAFTLTVDDIIFGHHRSHGEILAQGLSAIGDLSDEELNQMIETFFNRSTL